MARGLVTAADVPALGRESVEDCHLVAAKQPQTLIFFYIAWAARPS
jgi:hypothetical protein